MKIMQLLTAIPFALCLGGVANAVPVTPVSYDMPNGYSGSYNYWDESYDGTGNTSANGAALSGGTGDLTDGVIATQNWNVVEAPAGAGPYVGWTINPVITFNFASALDFLSATLYFDDSNGAGGVAAPASVSVNGVNTAIADPEESQPFAVTIDLSGTTSDTLTLQIFRRSSWVFLSEVEFDAASSATAVPVPASVLLLGSALAGLGLRRRARG